MAVAGGWPQAISDWPQASIGPTRPAYGRTTKRFDVRTMSTRVEASSAAVVVLTAGANAPVALRAIGLLNVRHRWKMLVSALERALDERLAYRPAVSILPRNCTRANVPLIMAEHEIACKRIPEPERSKLREQPAPSLPSRWSIGVQTATSTVRPGIVPVSASE